MNAERIAELKKLFDESSQGEWLTSDKHINNITSCGGHIDCIEVYSRGGLYASWIAQFMERLAAVDKTEGRANAAFSVAIHNATQDLLQSAEDANTYRAQLEDAWAFVDELRQQGRLKPEDEIEMAWLGQYARGK